MKRENNDIERINDEIERIIGESDDSLANFEDSGDTKKIDSIDEIDFEDVGNTKRIDSIDEIDGESTLESESIEEKSSLENISDKSNDITEKVDNNVTDKEKKNKKKELIIIISIISFVVVIAISFTLYFLLFNKENVEVDDSEKLSKSEQEEIVNSYGEALEKVISVYYQKEGKLLKYTDANKMIELDDDVSCKVHEIYEDGLVYLKKCTINGEETAYGYGEKQEKREEPIVKEGNVKVYVNKTNKEATLNVPKYVENYDVYSFNINGAYSELTLLDKKKSSYVFYSDGDYNVQMIDYKSGNRVFSNVNYNSVMPIMLENGFDTNMIGVNMNNKWGIYNLNTGSCVVYPKYDLITVNLNIGVTGPSLYATALDRNKLAVFRNGSVGVIDYTNDSEIIPVIYNGMLKSGDYLWAIDSKNNGHIFDFNGNIYLDGKYSKIYDILDGKYVLVNDNNLIELVDVNGREIYNYGKIEVGNYSYGLPYNKGILFQFIQDGDNNNKCVELIYDFTSREGKVRDASCGGIG